VTNTPRLASEGAPAVFTISGATTGATCKASEPTVPTGYTKNESDCQNGDPLNGSCTIVNTPDAARTSDVIASSGFETGGAEGWSLNGGAKVDGTVAIGQYALLFENNGTNSVRSVSTSGYSGVSVTVNLAAQGLQKGDVCHAELSTNGGSTWSSVQQVGDGLDNASFRSASVSPSAASDNANLRCDYAWPARARRRWGDEIVSGTPMSSTPVPPRRRRIRCSCCERIRDSATNAGSFGVSGGYGSREFDPGFDHLFGDGAVVRDVLAFDDLMSGRSPVDPVAWTAFAVPAGAAQPAHLFEGELQLMGSNASLGNALPAFSFEFVQLEHAYLGRGAARKRIRSGAISSIRAGLARERRSGLQPSRHTVYPGAARHGLHAGWRGDLPVPRRWRDLECRVPTGQPLRELTIRLEGLAGGGLHADVPGQPGTRHRVGNGLRGRLLATIGAGPGRHHDGADGRWHLALRPQRCEPAVVVGCGRRIRSNQRVVPLGQFLTARLASSRRPGKAGAAFSCAAVNVLPFGGH
jgi:hypothetical protein